MRYIVLKAKSPFDLEKVVTLHIKEEWTPKGGITVQGQYYYQAMIKHVDNIALDKKQPHVRIEFDDICDVPKVWVDGELMGDGTKDKALDSLKIDWNTDIVTENHKYFDISYYDLTGKRPMRRGLSEGSVM